VGGGGDEVQEVDEEKRLRMSRLRQVTSTVYMSPDDPEAWENEVDALESGYAHEGYEDGEDGESGARYAERVEEVRRKREAKKKMSGVGKRERTASLASPEDHLSPKARATIEAKREAKKSQRKPGHAAAVRGVKGEWWVVGMGEVLAGVHKGYYESLVKRAEKGAAKPGPGALGGDRDYVPLNAGAKPLVTWFVEEGEVVAVDKPICRVRVATGERGEGQVLAYDVHTLPGRLVEKLVDADQKWWTRHGEIARMKVPEKSDKAKLSRRDPGFGKKKKTKASAGPAGSPRADPPQPKPKKTVKKEKNRASHVKVAKARAAAKKAVANAQKRRAKAKYGPPR